jgi:hypothetical protein
MSKHHGRPAVPVKGRRKPLPSHNRGKDYFCTVISEDVEIALKNRPSFGINSKNELFVKCNQSECQYVDLNQSPCPLRLDLFAEEIEKREEKRRDKRMGF